MSSDRRLSSLRVLSCGPSVTGKRSRASGLNRVKIYLKEKEGGEE